MKKVAGVFRKTATKYAITYSEYSDFPGRSEYKNF